MKLYSLILLITLALFVKADIYSVIVSGSSGYSNYRHQADAAHAYHVLLDNGVPAENIIVMTYNDIAYNVNNPLRGQIHNAPSGEREGRNFYEGLVIDYEGLDVNVNNYLAVLRGDKDGVKGGSGRVLESGAEDEVFLVYSDHGAVGYIKFPDPEGYIYEDGETDLFADQLMDVFDYMHKHKKYQTLNFYLSACHSGSMFENLPDDINVYALSAANADQSGWGCFCPGEGLLNDRVDGISIDACLSSQFPASWLYNTDLYNTNSESLESQFNFVKTTTTGSQVQQWGTQDFKQWPISKFMGGENQEKKPFQASTSNFLGKIQTALNLPQLFKGITENKEEQRFIQTNWFLRQFQKTPSKENFEQLQKDLNTSAKFDQVFSKLAEKYDLDGSYPGTTDYECYREALFRMRKQCGNMNDYSLHYSKYLYQFCAQNRNHTVEFDC